VRPGVVGRRQQGPQLTRGGRSQARARSRLHTQRAAARPQEQRGSLRLCLGAGFCPLGSGDGWQARRCPGRPQPLGSRASQGPWEGRPTGIITGGKDPLGLPEAGPLADSPSAVAPPKPSKRDARCGFITSTWSSRADAGGRPCGLRLGSSWGAATNSRAHTHIRDRGSRATG